MHFGQGIFFYKSDIGKLLMTINSQNSALDLHDEDYKPPELSVRSYLKARACSSTKSLHYLINMSLN